MTHVRMVAPAQTVWMIATLVSVHQDGKVKTAMKVIRTEVMEPCFMTVFIAKHMGIVLSCNIMMSSV